MELAHQPSRRTSSRPPIAAPAGNKPVFATWRTPAGRWSIVAPCCRDLSGRIGVRRIAVLDEPAAAAAAAGGSKVIKLKERAGIDQRA